MANKKKGKKKEENKLIEEENKGFFLKLIVLIVIIAAIIFIAFKDKIVDSDSTAAIVNGEEITVSEIDNLYSKLPPDYQQFITKEQLLDQAISEKLLLQEAKSLSIEVTDEEVTKEIDDAIALSGLSKDEFESKLNEQDMTMDELKQYHKNRLIINELLNENAFGDLTIDDAEISDYYEKSNLDLPEDEAKEQIREFLISQKKQSIVEVYIKQLRNKADIQIFLGDREITFEETGKDICKVDDKPIIRLYSTKKSPESELIRDTFDSIMKDNEGIVAHHWQLDEGDDLLTEEKESGIPKAEYELFKKINPDMTVPTFLFGCKYVRIGNGHENLDDEAEEFQKIIDELKNE